MEVGSDSSSSLAVVYCDNHVLVVSKPAGIPTQASPHHSSSLEEQAKEWIRVTYAKPGAVFLRAVHRIDTPVTGLVLFARTSKALSKLNEAQRARAVTKTYRAILEHCPAPRSGSLQHCLIHASFRANVVSRGTAGSKQATLRYRTLKTVDSLALVEVELVTGRYHQIRCQFGTVGCPVLGDRKYGGTSLLPPRHIALHHHKLAFPHPTRRHTETVEVASPRWWPRGFV